MKEKSEIEKEIAEDWKAILKDDSLTLDGDSHFFRVGGTSLLALEVVSSISTKYSIKISLLTLAKKPTISELAEQVASQLSQISEGVI